MSSKFSSAFVVTLLLSHTVLAPLTAVAQEQDASPQQVQKTTDSNSNESVEAAQKEGAESIDDGKPDKTPQDASPQQVQETTDSNSNESVKAAQRAVAEPIDNWMPDKNLQNVVAGALGLEVSKITKSDMLQLDSLYYNGEDKVKVKSLEGIQYASNLRRLILNFNQITDLTPLQQLSKLSILRLEGNQITDLTPLRDLSNLVVLDLMFNHISDLTPLQNMNLKTLEASDQTITLPTIYVLNKQPYSASVQTAIKGLAQGTLTISPQNSDSWIGNYSGVDGSGKVEWSSANPVPEQGELVLTWTNDHGNTGQNFLFSGKYVQPYILSKATITAHNSTIYVGDNWQARDNFDSALDHDGNPLDFSKIAVSGTVDTGRPGVYSIVYSYDGLEEKVEVTVEEKPSNSEPSKGEVTPEEKPSAPEASKGEVQSKKEKASKELPATGEKDTKIFSAIGLGILAILAILGTYISRKKRSDS